MKGGEYKMIIKKYEFRLATNKVGSDVSEIVELEFEDDLTQEQIENQVNEYYAEWVGENNYGGWNEK
jgi:hypothetical protein